MRGGIDIAATMIRLISIGCVALACALAVAACGSSHKSNAGDPVFAQALKFSNCMRAHGVSNFPDPTAGGGLKLVPGSGPNPQSPSFQSAQKACSKYAPRLAAPPKMSASERRKAVKFAECMRANGEPDFPDPTLGSPSPNANSPVLALHGMFFQLTPGLNPMSQAFKQAVSRCGIRPPPGKPGNVG
jgi:hypothetical protein